jgi:hypothetical protein
MESMKNGIDLSSLNLWKDTPKNIVKLVNQIRPSKAVYPTGCPRCGGSSAEYSKTEGGAYLCGDCGESYVPRIPLTATEVRDLEIESREIEEE